MNPMQHIVMLYVRGSPIEELYKLQNLENAPPPPARRLATNSLVLVELVLLTRMCPVHESRIAEGQQLIVSGWPGPDTSDRQLLWPWPA